MPLRGDRLRQLRQSRGFTQEALAERLNLGIRQIHRYERGLSDPAGNIVAKIARELKVSTDYLLGLTDQPNHPLNEDDLTDQEQGLLSAFRRRDTALLNQILNAELGNRPASFSNGPVHDVEPPANRKGKRRTRRTPPRPGQ
jgi:transcriptional regulator with XRE-family HTH domain